MSSNKPNPVKLWKNADGLLVRFNGEQGKHAWNFAVTSENGKIMEASATINLAALGAAGASFTSDNDNNDVLDGFQEKDFVIPAGYVVEEARVIVTEAGTGGTSIALQTYAADGTLVTANGIVTATQGAVANLTANAVIVGTGSLVGTRIATAVFPAIKALGTFTAGEVEVQLRLRDAR